MHRLVPLAFCPLFPVFGLTQAPDRILYYGKILAVDSDSTVASAIAIRGDRILAVGGTGPIRAYLC